MSLRTVWIVALFAFACGTEPGPEKPCTEDEGDPAHERYGTDCLCCHEEFGAAGSVDPDGPAVKRFTITDTDGVTAIVSVNAYDNFFVRGPLTPPLDVVVEGMEGGEHGMTQVEHGSCNRCHTGEGLARVHGP